MRPAEEKFYFYYFLVHIPITTFIDASVVLPGNLQFSKDLVAWHIKNNNDFLLYEKPLWLKAFVLVELLFQLPGFFWFVIKFKEVWRLRNHDSKETKALLKSTENTLTKWLHVYGWNASATTFICLITVWLRGYYPFGDFLPMPHKAKFKLISLYIPYLLIPLRLLFV
ncbi:LAMI_0G08680g1_1 [Lachancea mirantina]|uniref:Efficient mitochondria targeting-associated protein 19 n=1 Tax=Lachancea mirantina TaxID=1230905 RepID=A0A1G4KA69_9SACH|nr:LAMI_0G08680g1_1 [Lachancea mirantina]